MDQTLSDPLVDRLLDGRYAIEARLARGGMASVYLATDVRLERRVAVKVMHPALAEDPEFIARFNREARAAARLSHPDAVAVYDQGNDGHHVFLVMEYVAGSTLREILRERSKLSPGEAVAVMDHVLAALSAAHMAGLVHRDVKPENVLVTADGRVKVVDFGLARAIAGTTLTTDESSHYGTPAYVSPEQVRDGTADARSDVYSAGVLFFELLTGSTPFTADSPLSVAYKHISDDVPAPSSRVRGIPAELDRLVQAATAREPSARPADARVLHAQLLAVRDRLGLHAAVPAPSADLTISIPTSTVNSSAAATAVVPAVDTQRTAALPPVPPGPPAGERRRRRRWPYAVAFVALLAVLGGLGGWWLAVGRYTHAPNVVTLTKKDAIAKLTSEGLRWRLGPAIYSDRVQAGLVAAESPHAGARVDKHAVITLELSKGPSAYNVPDLAGQPIAAAKKQLRAQHFKVGKVHRAYSDTVDRGLVIRVDPTGRQPVGTTVNLVVSRGAKPVAIPDVRGMSPSKAANVLSKAGFTVGATTQAFSDSVPNGKVIDSSPGFGAKQQPGATVGLVVSKGPQLFQVPDVTNMPIARAIQIINSAPGGFHAAPKQIFPGGQGKVVRETPTGMQPRGTTIELDYY